MTYGEWRATYEDRKLKFMQENEREFGRLLTTLRKGIFIPDKVDGRWKKHVKELLRQYAEDYERLLRRQLGEAIDFELEGRRLEAKPFIRLLDEHQR